MNVLVALAAHAARPDGRATPSVYTVNISTQIKGIVIHCVHWSNTLKHDSENGC